MVADRQGEFELEIPLERGENTLRVEADGVLGERTTDVAHIVRDDEPPTADITVGQ